MGVSGGTATPAVVTVAGTVLGGAMIGAGVEMAYTMLQDYMVDGAIDYAKNQYAAAGIRGAVSGGLASAGGAIIPSTSTTVASTATTLAKESVWTGAGFMTGDAISQQYQYGTIDYGKAAMYGMQAGATSYAMGTIMPYAENVVYKLGSKTFNFENANTYNSSDVLGETNFYVRSNGETIPAMGYRYMPSDALYLEDLKNTMIIPGRTEGTYISFDRYNVASPSKLQVPHDASVRAQFNTLQIIDDIKIPYGNWGKANYLEPIIKDYPNFGTGGATQAITHSSIKIDEIFKLNR